MKTAWDNPGADEYCRANADADVVPAFATGHDTVWSYRCAGGRAVIVGPTLSRYARGFAARLWAPLDEPIPRLTGHDQFRQCLGSVSIG